MSLRNADLREAASLLRKVLAALLAAVPGQTKATGADLFRLVGSLSANADEAINLANLGVPLQACFNAAYRAGATLASIGQVRSLIIGAGVSGKAAVVVQQSCLRMALIEEAKILSKTPLVSRRDVDVYLARMNAAFELAELFAADQRDVDTYRALTSLHAVVAQDLNTRGRPLPRMLSYNFPVTKTALSLSNRLYGDGSRADNLIRENRPFNPLFCPRSGVALAN